MDVDTRTIIRVFVFFPFFQGTDRQGMSSQEDPWGMTGRLFSSVFGRECGWTAGDFLWHAVRKAPDDVLGNVKCPMGLVARCTGRCFSLFT